MTSVLAVDDSRSLRQLLAQTLRAAGYHVEEAADGLDALDKMAATPADVVVTDQNMPRMDGLELTRRLRADPRFACVPVLVLTTEDGEEIRSAGRAAGATGWMVKPFDPARLLQVMAQVAPPPQGH